VIIGTPTSGNPEEAEQSLEVAEPGKVVPSPNKMLNPSRKHAAKPLVMAQSPPPAKKVIPDKVASPERTIIPGASSSNMAPPLNTSTPAKGDSFALWSVQFLCPVNWRYLFHTCHTWSVHSKGYTHFFVRIGYISY